MHLHEDLILSLPSLHACELSLTNRPRVLCFGDADYGVVRIYRVAGSDITDPRDCSVYLLDVGELVMIDAGFGESTDLVVSHVKEQGLNPRDISTVILTHCHVDHIGGADQFRHRFGSRLVMHELDAEIVARGDERLTAAFCFQKVFRAFP